MNVKDVILIVAVTLAFVWAANGLKDLYDDSQLRGSVTYESSAG